MQEVDTPWTHSASSCIYWGVATLLRMGEDRMLLCRSTEEVLTLAKNRGIAFAPYNKILARFALASLTLARANPFRWSPPCRRRWSGFDPDGRAPIFRSVDELIQLAGDHGYENHKEGTELVRESYRPQLVSCSARFSLPDWAEFEVREALEGPGVRQQQK